MAIAFPAHLASSIFCFIASILTAYQAYKHPKKLRYIIVVYSILTLPASIVTTLHVEGYISSNSNSLVYLISTFLMTVVHFLMLFDVAHRLRVDGKSWKHPLVIVAIIFSSLACIILLVQIFMLGINHKIDFPAKWMFIFGVVVAMLGDGSMFTYTFKPLIYWRKNRMNEGYSRTTALGIWYYMIQNIWYVCFGAVYVWFFIKNSWDYFPTMLALDYALRFIENLLYTWPPPACFIDYVTSLLPSNSIHLSTRVEGSHVMSSERYNKEATVEYGDTIKPAAASTNSTYGSKVTIMT